MSGYRKKWLAKNRAEGYSLRFIEYALKNLPEQTYIIFTFDWSEQCFVQFGNDYGEIFLDLPFWETNSYKDQEKNILKLLRKKGFVRRYWKRFRGKNGNYVFYNQPVAGNRGKVLKIEFGRDFKKATEVALAIVEKAFYLQYPRLTSYQSDRFSS